MSQPQSAAQIHRLLCSELLYLCSNTSTRPMHKLWFSHIVTIYGVYSLRRWGWWRSSADNTTQNKQNKVKCLIQFQQKLHNFKLKLDFWPGLLILGCRCCFCLLLLSQIHRQKMGFSIMAACAAGWWYNRIYLWFYFLDFLSSCNEVVK